MGGFRAKFGTGFLVIFSVWISVAALFALMKPIPNRCIMTYMYPTYIPIATPKNVSPDKYGLFLYHEGWKQIDFAEHVRNLNGVPVLFIPGNGGSYKQVRSLAAESSRAYQNGPLEPAFYREASIIPDGLPLDESEDFSIPSQYSQMLDWFAVDLEEEHSAMDSRILEEHTEYVVYAIHRILDQYKESLESRAKDFAESSSRLPTSVILVGHSMGGFVARAALVHPHLRKSAVETILTLSSPHLYPPVALQPSLGQYFSNVNEEWRKGYKAQGSRGSQSMNSPKLSTVVVVSLFGGVHDYQVRSKLASLDGIVPSTHGFLLGSSGMKNVWVSTEHQTILWCNQLVVQISHTLLSMVDPVIGQPFSSTKKRLFVLTKMLRSAIPEALSWTTQASTNGLSNDGMDATESQIKGHRSCPQSVHWISDGLEKDLYIKSNSVTVLAMDGRRRWLDIQKLGSNGKGHFVFVTNLAPCSGVRIHLWPKKHNSSLVNDIPASNKILEVTSKIVQVPAGPAPRQVEPGSQTEQPPPSGFLLLSPDELSGYRYITISVAPRPTVSGRPPPAASMAVGQFFNPKEGARAFSAGRLVRSSYVQEELFLKEDHPLALNLLFSISLGLLPVKLSLSTTGCGIKNPSDQLGEAERNNLCKLRCFPPVALAWDSVSGLHVIPNIYSETVLVDSSPALLNSNQGPEKTIVVLLADPHCSYKISVSVSLTSAAGRFFLLYSSQVIGFMIAAVFFALMRQAYAWELDSSVPSVLSAMEMNLRIALPFVLLWFMPIVLSFAFSWFRRKQHPPFSSFLSITMICYLVANGFAIILVLCSKMILHFAAIVHVFVKRRWQVLEDSLFISQRLTFSSTLHSLKIVQIIKGNPNIVVVCASIPLVCFVHPAIGLIILLLSHGLYAHSALCSVLAASFCNHAQRKDFHRSKNDQNKASDGLQQLLPTDENSVSPTAAKSFADSQLELFNYRHGIVVLHLFATLMFMPSFVAWLQRNGMGQNFPWFIDSAVCVGVVLHGIFGSSPNASSLSFTLPCRKGREVGLSLVYLLAGYYSFFSGMALAPYRALYAMVLVGAICFISRVLEMRSRVRGDISSRKNRKHSHKH